MTEHLQPVTRFRFRRSRVVPARRTARLPVPALVILGLVVLIAVVGPLLSPYGETEGTLATRMVAPWSSDPTGAFHLLGTDPLGRDVAVRIGYGARVSLLVGVLGVALACTIGTVVGLVSGITGKVVDTALMRVTDISLSIPGLLVAILLAAVFRPSIVTIFVSVGLLLWPDYARLVRGEVLVLRNSDFVALARVAGCSTTTIIRRHLLPNVVPSLIVLATLQVGAAIILEASVSFLGVGLPPDAASWGSMIDLGRQYITSAWWLTVVPGLFIFMTVISFNTLGDWARIRFDPRLEATR